MMKTVDNNLKLLKSSIFSLNIEHKDAVPGTLVSHIDDKNSFGLLISKVGETCWILWSEKPHDQLFWREIISNSIAKFRRWPNIPATKTQMVLAIKNTLEPFYQTLQINDYIITSTKSCKIIVKVWPQKRQDYLEFPVDVC